jgi:hypothetical protein
MEDLLRLSTGGQNKTVALHPIRTLGGEIRVIRRNDTFFENYKAQSGESRTRNTYLAWNSWNDVLHSFFRIQRPAGEY